jgi:hypothetical protein
MIEPVARLHDYIERIDLEARALLAGDERAYDVGIRLLSLGMGSVGDEELDAVAMPVYLIWGSLTDLIDGPRGDEPGAEQAATAMMKRASSEWLDVSGDAASLAAYLDRWVYVECGYRRPDG